MLLLGKLRQEDQKFKTILSYQKKKKKELEGHPELYKALLCFIS